MKYLILSFVLSNTISLLSAQTPYTSVPDPQQPGGKILNGVISKYIFINDTSCTWYKPSQDIFTPKKEVVDAFNASKGKFSFLIFGGSWCDDTHFVLPKFFRLQELSGVPDSAISFIGVDRDKRSLGNLTQVFEIKNVPTIIVLKEGKEVGRVVEYGKTGQWDTELADLLK